MKKVFSIVTFILLVCSTKLMAQPPEGRQMDPAMMKERNEKTKAKLKEELKLTDAQADSVIAVQIEMMPKMRGMRGLQPEERMSKMKELQDALKARLTKALGDEKLAVKVLEYQEKQRREMMEKMRELRPQE